MTKSEIELARYIDDQFGLGWLESCRFVQKWSGEVREDILSLIRKENSIPQPLVS